METIQRKIKNGSLIIDTWNVPFSVVFCFQIDKVRLSIRQPFWNRYWDVTRAAVPTDSSRWQHGQSVSSQAQKVDRRTLFTKGQRSKPNGILHCDRERATVPLQTIRCTSTAAAWPVVRAAMEIRPPKVEGTAGVRDKPPDLQTLTFPAWMGQRYQESCDLLSFF